MIQTLVNLRLSVRTRMRGTTWCDVSAVGLLAGLTIATPVPEIPEAKTPKLICDRQPRAIGRAIAKRELGLDATVVVLAVNTCGAKFGGDVEAVRAWPTSPSR